MDIKQYLESGIIESYVLGAASPQEMREVNCLSAIYPEIKSAVEEQQKSIESYIESIAVQPPARVKTEILKSIQKVNQVSSDSTTEPKKGEIRKLDFTKYGLAASVLIIAGLIFFLNSNSQKLIQNNKTLSQQDETIKSLQNKGESESILYQESINKLMDKNNILTSADTKLIALSGSEVSPSSKVRVFWNQSLSELVVIQDELPDPNEKQYQLWAISNGKPIDLGVLIKNEKVSNARPIELTEVDAFAITLEVDGGAPSPDLSQLYVIGNT